MDPIAGCLNHHGFHALRVSFHDRASRPEGLPSCWLSEMAGGYRELEARYPELPVYNLSFSLGALVTIRFLELEGAARFERMVFLAPAIALTRRAGLVRCLRPLRSLGLSLPSVAPRSLRARDATPIAEYAAMLDLMDYARIVSRRVGRIPTAVLASRRDEVVSFEGIESWMRRNRLENWTLKAVHPEASPAPCLSYEHLSVLETVRQPSSRLHREILRHFGVRTGSE